MEHWRIAARNRDGPPVTKHFNVVSMSFLSIFAAIVAVVQLSLPIHRGFTGYRGLASAISNKGYPNLEGASAGLKKNGYCLRAPPKSNWFCLEVFLSPVPGQEMQGECLRGARFISPMWQR